MSGRPDFPGRAGHLSRFSKGGKPLAHTYRFLIAELQPQVWQGLHQG